VSWEKVPNYHFIHEQAPKSKVKEITFKEFLSNWTLPFQKSTQLVEPMELIKAFEKIKPLLNDAQPKIPTKYDLDETYQVLKKTFDNTTLQFIINTLKRYESFDNIEKIHLYRAPFVVFNFPNENDCELGRSKSFTNKYLKWLEDRQKVSAIKNLLFSFLKNYPDKLPTFDVWRTQLKDIIVKNNSKRLYYWREKCQKYPFLETSGAEKFAGIILEYEERFEKLLDNAGLTGELEKRGFLRSAYHSMLNKLASDLRTGKCDSQILYKILDFSSILPSNDNYFAKGKLRYDNDRKYLAQALLAPYADGQISLEHKQTIQAFLLEHLGDPRISQSRWVGVPSECLEIMKTWLVFSTLEDFFHILDTTADPIWLYRKAFWQAYLKKNCIREAWVVLGSRAHSLAKRKSIEHYGRLSGASGNQSVLLMRIDNLIIAEWSHSGKCRIWHAGGQGRQNYVPQFYQNKYSSDSLRVAANWWKIHHGAERGNWQHEVAGYIEKYTNIQISRNEYMKRRY